MKRNISERIARAKQPVNWLSTGTMDNVSAVATARSMLAGKIGATQYPHHKIVGTGLPYE